MAKFVDFWTRFTVVDFTRRKNEALSTLIEFVQDLAIPLGLRVQRLRMDQGTEYTDNTFREYCKKAGIVQQFTVSEHCLAERH